MTRDLEYNITAQDNGVTISDYLKKQGFSHAVTVQLKKIPESILLNGKWEYMSTRLNDGDCLFIHFEETEGSENIVATNLPLSICYEDEDILVVNKPADPVLLSWTGETDVLYNIIVGLLGVNFLVELGVNVVLSPIVVRILKAVKAA